MAVIHANEEAFTKLLESGEPMLVDFFATWCGPCKMLAPIIEELAADYKGKLHVLKLDTDENQSIAMNYGIMNIPTVVLFRGGNEVDRLVGVLPKESFCQMIDSHL